MVCQKCGKEMRLIGELTDEERKDFYFVNEKVNCAYQALNDEVYTHMKFTDGQVYEYFKAAYDTMAEARFIQHVFMRDLQRRLGSHEELTIEELTCKIYIHKEG